LIDSSGEEVIVKHVVCEEVYAEFKKRNVAGQIVEPPNRDEWVNWGRK
jgi:hypothetical protein